MSNLDLAASRFLAALDLQQRGRLSEAEAAYREALALAPGRESVLNNLATVLLQLQRHDEALDLCRQALAANPDNVQALNNRAMCLVEMGGVRDALPWVRRALQLDPRDAQAHLNHGVILGTLGRLSEALAACDAAAALMPDPAPAQRNRASVLARLERARRALDEVRAELDNDPQSARAAATFVTLLRGGRLALDHRDEPLHALAIRAVSEGWARARSLLEPLLMLLEVDPEVDALLADAGEAAGEGGMAVMRRKPLLLALMQNEVLADARYERLMTATRRRLLQRALSSGAQDDPQELAFYCVLARQCFINEYAWDAGAEELRLAGLLRDRLAALVNGGGACSPALLATVACYFPLHALNGCGALLKHGQGNEGEALAGLLRQQVAEPLRECELRAAMPRLTAIEDRVSQAVRQQYEDNPFPRWMVPLRFLEAKPLGACLSARYPAARPGPAHDGRPFKALVAGCGTGQHAIDVARSYAGIELTAIDLSLGSLAYARRKAEEMGIANIRFAQADILGLQEFEERFALIESVGVLHHMHEPERGLRVLAGLLEPGGVMKLGLYSELGRRHIVAVRRLIAGRGHAATPEGMRRLRREIMQLDERALEKSVMLFSDFYSLSECRDLLFHVQEHRYGVPDLKRMLDGLELEFAGFEVVPEVAKAYRARFPGDAALISLDNWHVFETEQPDLFAGMYQFWVQKRISGRQDVL